MILIKGDALPERLRGIAAELWQSGSVGDLISGVNEEGGAQIDNDLLIKLADLRREIAAMALVEPAMTAQDLDTAEIPPEDIDMLTQIAMRERDTDARGVKLGVVPLSRFDAFREEHGCPEDCPACKAAAERLSTRSLDLV
jgi:hypothetical protein